MQSESSRTVPENDDINMIDILLILVQNIRLLLIAPVVGLGAMGAASLMPANYESKATQIGDGLLFSMYQSESVRDAVIAELSYAKPGESPDAARHRLDANLNISFNNKNKTVQVTARAATPEAAQRLAEVVVAQANQINQFRASQVELLRAQVELAAKFDIAPASKLEVNANSVKLAPVNGGLDMIRAQNGLATQLAQNNLLSMLDALSRAQNFDLIQRPSLPSSPVRHRGGKVAIVATLGASFLILLFIFIRHSLRSAKANPESAHKLIQLRAAWRQATGLGQRP